MTYTIFGDKGSGAFSAEAVLAEAGAPYEFHFVSLEKNEQRKPEFLAINPSGKIPALRLPEGEVITESAGHPADHRRSLSQCAPVAAAGQRRAGPGLSLARLHGVGDLSDGRGLATTPSVSRRRAATRRACASRRTSAFASVCSSSSASPPVPGCCRPASRSWTSTSRPCSRVGAAASAATGWRKAIFPSFDGDRGALAPAPRLRRSGRAIWVATLAVGPIRRGRTRRRAAVSRRMMIAGGALARRLPSGSAIASGIAACLRGRAGRPTRPGATGAAASSTALRGPCMPRSSPPTRTTRSPGCSRSTPTNRSPSTPTAPAISAPSIPSAARCIWGSARRSRTSCAPPASTATPPMSAPSPAS